MDEATLRVLLRAVRSGALDEDAALARLRTLPFENLGDVRLDTHRALRTGFPEVVYAAGKSDEQLRRIARSLAGGTEDILISRATEAQYDLVRREIPEVQYAPEAHLVYLRRRPGTPWGNVAVVSGGSSDVPVAEEAALVAETLGCVVTRTYDVGVAGLHRLLASLEILQHAHAVVAVAGMDGALPSVVAGLVACPVFAVPTSVGYGAAFGGVAPLLSMLNACAPGVAVVNIDNGFGGGYCAALAVRHQEKFLSKGVPREEVPTPEKLETRWGSRYPVSPNKGF